MLCCNIDGWTVLWIRNCLDGDIQRVTVNGSISDQKSVMSAVPEGSILGPGLFNVSINNTDRGMECTPSKPAGDTKLCGAADMPEEWDVIQRDRHKPENWVHGNPIRFNKAKYKAVCLGQANPSINRG